MRKGRGDRAALDTRLAAIVGRVDQELSGLSVVVAKGDRIAYEGYFGHRYIDQEDGSRSLPVDSGTKFRIASISKPVVCVGAMILVERGLLDLGADLSEYLGFELRNPHWPQERITSAMLLSHVSSIRDADRYNLPLPLGLRELLVPGGAYYEGGAHFAAPVPGADTRPGRYFRYCNLNYGILATAMERISGERFDLYMRDKVLRPLGLDAGFNLLHLSDEGIRSLAALYRKADPEDEDDSTWDPRGPWKPQFDDHRGLRPAIAWRSSPGLGPEALEAYELGSNGTLFSPQGGLRISPRDLSMIMRLLMNGGEIDGTRLLSRESVGLMTACRWRFDPSSPNGHLDYPASRETGLALMRTTNSRDEHGCDMLLPSGGPLMWGHHGDAYGLLGAMLFDPESSYGFIYMIGGTSLPPNAGHRGSYSSYFAWEEEIQRAVLEETWEGEGR